MEIFGFGDWVIGEVKSKNKKEISYNYTLFRELKEILVKELLQPENFPFMLVIVILLIIFSLKENSVRLLISLNKFYKEIEEFSLT